MRVGRAAWGAYLPGIGEERVSKNRPGGAAVGAGRSRTLAGTGCAGRSRGASCRLARVCTAPNSTSSVVVARGSAVLDTQRGECAPNWQTRSAMLWSCASRSRLSAGGV